MDYWLKQAGEPLFPELEWNKPERRDQAGRLLIIGGYQHNLNAPGKAFEYTKKAGIGDIQIALPHKVKQLVGSTLPGAIFLPSTASGELASEGLEELMAHVDWADTLLLPGDLGRNSQTTLLVADLITSSSKQAILTCDAADALQNTPELLVNREQTTLVLSFAQLQKMVQNLKQPQALTFNMDLVKLVEFLHEFTANHPCSVVTLHQNKFIVASGGNASTTAADGAERWRLRLASLAACYQTWNPEKPFEALTHTCHKLS